MNAAFLLCIAAFVGHVAGHGRLTEPPSRASAWRFGFKTPPNYQDNELFCGGFTNQQKHGGKCGVCGDPYQGPREHEAGGKYATGTVVRRYHQGDRMAVGVHLTANHKGWMEFRLCENNDPKKPVTFDCLNRHLLKIAGTKETRFKVSQEMEFIELDLELPAGVTCTQCVLQWKYHAGNSWGVDANTGKGCIGCGPQEEFYGCADVAIGRVGFRTKPPRKSNSTPRSRVTTPPAMKTTPPTKKATVPSAKTTPSRSPIQSTPSVGGWCGQKCCSVGIWRKLSNMNKWCNDNCSRGFCPQSHCLCMP